MSVRVIKNRYFRFESRPPRLFFLFMYSGLQPVFTGCHPYCHRLPWAFSRGGLVRKHTPIFILGGSWPLREVQLDLGYLPAEFIPCDLGVQVDDIARAAVSGPSEHLLLGAICPSDRDESSPEVVLAPPTEAKAIEVLVELLEGVIAAPIAPFPRRDD